MCVCGVCVRVSMSVVCACEHVCHCVCVCVCVSVRLYMHVSLCARHVCSSSSIFVVRRLLMKLLLLSP